VVYGASLGEAVSACAAGRVINVHNDAELGHVVVLDLGDGYQAIYGQVDNITVPIGAKIDAGAQLATIAEPTKYYSVEGSNLYFQLKKDGESIDPSQFFE
jgi:septal ring factor EnvC (AmiA/AmiB activator)